MQKSTPELRLALMPEGKVGGLPRTPLLDLSQGCENDWARRLVGRHYRLSQGRVRGKVLGRALILCTT